MCPWFNSKRYHFLLSFAARSLRRRAAFFFLGSYPEKTVQPTSNKKALKIATAKANSEGKKLTTEERKAIRAQNALTRKNASKNNKSIERWNAVKQTTINAVYNTHKYYEEKKKR